ncbi:MAG: hemolysin family protein, partial [Actinomycetota bacterium]|nr:hemolysin family protein [Actinomycetota bacterium]
MSVGAVLASLGLLAANAFFVASEFALLAVRRPRLEQLAASGNRQADVALASERELSLMLAAAQLGITMASLGLGAVAEPALVHGLEALLGGVTIPEALRHAIAVAVGLAIIVFLHIVVGEMAPKSWAIASPERSALLLARPFRGFSLVARPFIRLLNALANGVVRAMGVTPQDERALAHSPDELLLLLRESAEHGTLGDEQRDLLARAVTVWGLDAQAVMIPRGDIVAVPADAGIDDLERVAGDTGRSRLLVFDGELDHVSGVLHVKDLLRVEPGQRAGVTAGELARPALVTPESRPVEQLMVDMRRERQHVAVVVDEYGTVSGLVALEDLLEEIIGEFEDETDPSGGRPAGGPR